MLWIRGQSQSLRQLLERHVPRPRPTQMQRASGGALPETGVVTQPLHMRLGVCCMPSNRAPALGSRTENPLQQPSVRPTHLHAGNLRSQTTGSDRHVKTACACGGPFVRSKNVASIPLSSSSIVGGMRSTDPSLSTTCGTRRCLLCGQSHFNPTVASIFVLPRCCQSGRTCWSYSSTLATSFSGSWI